MGVGVSFAGNGGQDVDLNTADTNPLSVGGSSEKVIEMAGNGNMDVTHCYEPKNETMARPSGDKIDFVAE